MTANIFCVSKLELENLLRKKLIWLAIAAYTLFIFIVSTSKGLQESYFSATDSLPIMLMNFIMPIFLLLIICFVLTPYFTSEKEQNSNQIPNACYLGRKGRNAAKIIASVALSVFICICLSISTLVICFLTGHFKNAGNITLKYIDDIELSFVWNIWQHFGFSFCCLLIGSVILTLLVLFISSNSKKTLTSVGITTMLIIFEILFNKFSFPLILKEFNIWVFFQPYYLYVFNIVRFLPYGNLLMLTLMFFPICCFKVWRIIKKGG